MQNNSYKHGNTVKVFYNGKIVFEAISLNGRLRDIEVIKNDLTKECLYKDGADIYLDGEKEIFKIHQLCTTDGKHLSVVPCCDTATCEAI